MIDITKKYETREGREVRLYCIDAGGAFPIHGAVKESVWEAFCWGVTGMCGSYGENVYDLIEVKPRIKLTWWCNLYPNNTPCFHSTQAVAISERSRNCIATIPVHIDCAHGEGLA